MLGIVTTHDSTGPGSQRTRCTEGITACLGHPVLMAMVTTGSQVALTPWTSGRHIWEDDDPGGRRW